MLLCTGIHPISRITCYDDIACQKIKRQVVTSQPSIRRCCETLPCLFSFSRAVFWKVLAGAQSQPQQSCLLHLLSPGLTAAAAAAANAAIAEAMKVKKIKLEAMSSYHSNANHHGGDGENGDLSSSVGESHTHTHQGCVCVCEFPLARHMHTCFKVPVETQTGTLLQWITIFKEKTLEKINVTY